MSLEIAGEKYDSRNEKFIASIDLGFYLLMVTLMEGNDKIL